MTGVVRVPKPVKAHFATVVGDRVKNPSSVRWRGNTAWVIIHGESASAGYDEFSDVDAVFLDATIVGPGGTDDVEVVVKPGGEAVLVINGDCGEEDNKDECDALYPLKRHGLRVLLRSLEVTANYPRRGRTTLTMIFEVLNRGDEP